MTSRLNTLDRLLEPKTPASPPPKPRKPLPEPSPPASLELLAKTWAMKLGAQAPLLMKILPRVGMPLPRVGCSNSGSGSSGELVGGGSITGNAGWGSAVGTDGVADGGLVRNARSPLSSVGVFSVSIV